MGIPTTRDDFRLRLRSRADTIRATIGEAQEGIAAFVERRRPEFSRYQGSGERDLGANGTFLVIRQLDQKKAEFDAWLDYAYDMIDAATTKVAMTIPNPHGADRRETVRKWIAARLVGRWHDGSSLVRNPGSPASNENASMKPDNAFLFGAEDPQGLKCPFGSHIRRANPRDTRFHSTPEESQTELDAINRHRILRVGRSYGYTDNAGDGRRHDGLLFMCLNADIERQFEFIQKTWLLNRNIHGLENEVDPFLGPRPSVFTIPLTSGPLRLTIDKEFVQVAGGSYFFVPSRSALRYLSRGVLAKAPDPLQGPH